MYRLPVILVAMLLPQLVRAEPPFHVYEATIVKSYINARGPKNLVSADVQGYAGASHADFIRDSYDTLRVHDPMQSRIATLDEEYSVVNSHDYKVDVSGDIFEVAGYLFAFTTGNEAAQITISQLDGKVLTVIQDAPLALRNIRGIAFHANLLFLFDLNRKWCSYHFPNGFEKDYTFSDDVATRNYLKTASIGKQSDIVLDDQDRLLLNNELVTQDYPTFKNYFSEKNGSIKKSGLAEELGADPNNFSASMIYLGRDAAGNWYWGGGQGAAVFSREGAMIDYFLFDAENWGRGFPHVSPNGDLYSLSWKGGQTVNLSLVKNVWDETLKVARLNDSRVRLRSGPDVSADVLGLVDRGTVVAILDSSVSVANINGTSSHWFKVRLRDGLVGWLFGAYLDSSQ